MAVYRELAHGLLQIADAEQGHVDATVEWCAHCQVLLVGRHAVIADRILHFDSILADCFGNAYSHEQVFLVLTRNLTCPICLGDETLFEYDRARRFSSEGSLNCHVVSHLLYYRTDRTHGCPYPGCLCGALSRDQLIEHFIADHGMALAGYSRAGDRDRRSFEGDLDRLQMNPGDRQAAQEGQLASISELTRKELATLASTLGVRHTGPDVDKSSNVDSLAQHTTEYCSDCEVLFEGWHADRI